VTENPSAEVHDLDYPLVRRVAKGDHQAFANLLQRHQQRVFRLAYRLLKNRPEAEDAAQEVFLKVYQHAGRFEPTGTVAAWINRIAANHCLNRLRSRSAHPEVLQDEIEPGSEGGFPFSHATTPLADLEGRELAVKLQEALGCLPENQRQALVLKRFGDLSYREIAELLGVSPEAVDGLIKRARAALRKALQDYV